MFSPLLRFNLVAVILQLCKRDARDLFAVLEAILRLMEIFTLPQQRPEKGQGDSTE